LASSGCAAALALGATVCRIDEPVLFVLDTGVGRVDASHAAPACACDPNLNGSTEPGGNVDVLDFEAFS
jgi:hypothetical protein